MRQDRIYREKDVTRADKVWLHSIIKRQYMVVDDLIKFAELYPDKVDREIVGSLFSIYEMLRDTGESIAYAHTTSRFALKETDRKTRLFR